MDIVAIVIGVMGLLGGFVVFIIFVSNRPTREEVTSTINQIVGPLAADVRYIRDRIDQMPVKKVAK